MNILFISISTLPHISKHSISLDLIHEFIKEGHNVYCISSLEKRDNRNTFLSIEEGCKVLRVKIGNNKKTNKWIKGITNVLQPQLYILAIKKYFADVKFDLVIYPTPPVTQVDTVRYIKKRDNAKSYLLLKDIFPQNAIDIGFLKKTGFKGIFYKYFCWKEKNLYKISDYIGCMSQANVDYIIKHNPKLDKDKVEICPNSVEIQDMRISKEENFKMREKYGLPLDKKIFVYGGNLSKPQGIPFLIECLKAQMSNRDAFFLIIGDGTDYKKLEGFIDTNNPDNIKLMKRLPKEDYDKLVSACDVGLIFLDHRFTIPNFPSRLLSYMQSGLPVLACTDINTDIGKVIIGGDFGWWCESTDVDAFKNLVSNALNSDLKKLGQNSMDYLKNNYDSKSAYKTILKSISKK